jgi:hypothetical protein
MPMPTKTECPECGAEAKRGAKACEACGAELGPKRPPPPQEASDTAKYAAIIGALVVIIAIVLFVAGGMGGSKHCQDCRGKGTIVCANCRTGTPKCVACKGSGKDQQTFSTCGRCGGKGEEASCSKCRGTPRTKCVSCGGDGVLEQN